MTNIDTSGEMMNCQPDLAFPDCPVEVAEGCVDCVCLSGCMDFYICKQTPMGLGWVDVAGCTDEGVFVMGQ